MSKSLSNGKANKAQDESNLKVLRELSHIAGNRHCFDCGQRGPTYVDVTIGSFICMTCSGLLRGLTPPHRVKSISMASFTAEEIELLKSRGNDYCRKVWLATCTSRDCYVSSDKDPDRQNTLRSFMSAKYEQKRFYVDPSKLPQSELNEIQAQTAKALSSSSSSISNSSTSTMQKSPSLSSASSASSLSLHNNNNQGNPSPILNNSRNNSNQMNSQNRLVNSITLPDIKPLSSLLGPASNHLAPSTTNHINGSKSNNLVAGGVGSLGLSNGKPTSTPVPINFINNLSSSISSQDKSGISSNMNGGSILCHKDPWGGDNNNFSANFADFDAFNSNPDDKINDGFGGGGFSNGVNDLNATTATSSSSNFANFDAFQHQPLLPASNGNSTLGITDSHSTRNFPPLISSTNGGGGGEDKYAALKDLDNIFKQGVNGDGNTGNGATGSQGLSSSASFPANLSSSQQGLSGGWFSSSPNQQQGGNSASGVTNGGWTVQSANGPNPHNPFFNNAPASPWQSSPAAASISNSLFSTSPAANTNGFQQAGGMIGGTSPALTNGFGTSANGTSANGLFSSSTTNGSNGLFSTAQPFQTGFNSKPVNPFFQTMPTPTVNPNNPFL